MARKSWTIRNGEKRNYTTGANTPKIALIIPLYRQVAHLPRILKGIEKQTVRPDAVYLMLDRGTNKEQTYMYDCSSKTDLRVEFRDVTEPPKYIGNADGKELFLTPHVRNVGINEALKDGCDIFIFIDGDCIPQPTLIKSHLKVATGNVPTLSVGRRRELKYRWQDRREFEAELCHLQLFRASNFVINNTELLKRSLIVWSCNIALNLKAVNLLKKFNKRYYNRDEVFSGEFVGKWGGEDGFLGAEAWHCRIFIAMLGNKSSGVEHIEHDRPESKYNINHRDFYLKQLELLRRKITINPLDMNFFSDY